MNTIIRGINNVADQVRLLAHASTLELCQEADDMLKDAGFDRWGRENSDPKQSRFEHRMATGAYSRNSEMRKR